MFEVVKELDLYLPEKLNDGSGASRSFFRGKEVGAAGDPYLDANAANRPGLLRSDSGQIDQRLTVSTVAVVFSGFPLPNCPSKGMRREIRVPCLEVFSASLLVNRRNEVGLPFDCRLCSNPLLLVTLLFDT